MHLKKGSDNNLCTSIEYNRIKKVRNYQKILFLLVVLKNKHIHKIEGTKDFILFFFFSWFWSTNYLTNDPQLVV